ncbi:MAG: hypothetical protein CME71_10100 [Halobacteriovorax sp.]|nr:hypothetical protein [Halobacteriovorax sp.]
MKALVLITIFFVNLAHAENFRVGSVAPSLRIEQSSQDFLDQVEVKKDGKSIFSYKADLVTQKLLQKGLVQFKDKKQPHLVTVWTGGAHGQELIIFDLSKYDSKNKEAAITYLYGSAWTIDLDINQERIEIKGKGEIDKDNEVAPDQTLTFKP